MHTREHQQAILADLVKPLQNSKEKTLRQISQIDTDYEDQKVRHDELFKHLNAILMRNANELVQVKFNILS